MSTDMRTAEVTRVGVLDLQVCVPASATDKEATDFANMAHPTGIQGSWVMKKTGNPTLAGDPERVPCEERPGHVHIMLEC